MDLKYYETLYDNSKVLGKLRYELEKECRKVYDESCVDNLDMYHKFFKEGFDLIVDGLEQLRKAGMLV